MNGHDLLGGRYRLGSRIGRGGMGEVRIGLDTRLGRVVAVKQLWDELAQEPAARVRFHREACSAARLNHPSIVAVLDSGEDVDPETGRPTPYIVMELVNGQTLRSMLREGQKVSPERALELTQGVLEALAHSHEAGVVHQDVKPANVMVTSSGGVKLMDFGIAKTLDEVETSRGAVGVVGTAKYLSPERVRGQDADARSDIYSTGCLLYELLVGRPPFIGDSPLSISCQHLHDAPVPPSQLNGAISPDLDPVTLKALAKSPDDRYQSAQEMSDDISRVRAAMTPAVVAAAGTSWAGSAAEDLPELPGPVVYTRPGPKHRRLALVSAATAVVLFPIGGLGLYGLSRNDEQSASASAVLDVTKSDPTKRPDGSRQAGRALERSATHSTPSKSATTRASDQGQPISQEQVARVGVPTPDEVGTTSAVSKGGDSPQSSAPLAPADPSRSATRPSPIDPSRSSQPEAPAQPPRAAQPPRTAQPPARPQPTDPTSPPPSSANPPRPSAPASPTKPAAPSARPTPTRPEPPQRPGDSDRSDRRDRRDRGDSDRRDRRDRGDSDRRDRGDSDRRDRRDRGDSDRPGHGASDRRDRGDRGDSDRRDRRDRGDSDRPGHGASDRRDRGDRGDSDRRDRRDRGDSDRRDRGDSDRRDRGGSDRGDRNGDSDRGGRQGDSGQPQDA